ncbi:beta-2-microglobulin-like [Anabas testudineus]|uniref:Beta-2-microglobulin n=1 Tax=Anabas testudineus TaxID=64144 RepID=A0A3Q1H5C2_ANATE|nr:beta-2-microglobulin-like [Anabas testudineus]
MKLLLCLAALTAVYCTVDSVRTPPKVQLYSRDPGEYNKENTLICHTSGFHPPDITIRILKDGKELPDAKQTDLSFAQDWRFRVTKYVPFKPQKGETFTCEVTHGSTKNVYSWEPNM